MTPFDSLPAALHTWQNFYLLSGTAAATLLGLMFVALTFGSSLVTRETAAGARAFVDPIYMHFVQVLLTACVATIPTLGPTLLGSLLLVVAATRVVGLAWVTRKHIEAQRKYGDVELSDWLVAVALPLVCHLLLAATGVGFVLRTPLALDGLALVTLALLAVGIQGAWELFVWLALAVNERRRDLPSATSAKPSDEKEPDRRGALAKPNLPTE